jgi:hypothetical protein
MSTPVPTRLLHAGLLGLPVYGLLTLWSAREPQPNPAEDYEAWSRFVTTPEYVLTHVLGSGLGLILAIFGIFALGAYLAPSRAGRLGLSAMVVTALGLALFLFVGGVSAFASPQEGQAYLAGIEGFDELPDSYASIAMSLVTLVSIVLSLVGHVMLGIAVWRSALLPRWAGVLWIAAALLMYPFGLVLGALTTGATPPTVLVGAGLVFVAGAWMFRDAIRRARSDAVADPRPMGATAPHS